ncbi:MAG: TolC family protein [Planctomycetota bacterium]|nr:TolC family protein [Planctomycetota bacterium]
MARALSRLPDSAQSERPARMQGRSAPALLLGALATLGACATYTPAPVDPDAVLAALEAVHLPPPTEGGLGATSFELARFALEHNPELGAARARLAVSEALLGGAGLLDAPTLGWDGMGALAAELAGDGATSVDFLAGLELSIELPLTGEREVERRLAKSQRLAAEQRVALAEWRLLVEVHLAVEDVLEARAHLQSNAALQDIARATDDYFATAREAGAATSIQANLAHGELLSIQSERLSLEDDLARARRRLNVLLGLRPGYVVPLGQVQQQSGERRSEGLEQLVQRALVQRPDLALALAAYAAAEEELHLAVLRQVPRLTVGTAFGIAPRLWTGTAQAELDARARARDVASASLTAAVHHLRAELHEARTAEAAAARIVADLEGAVLPNAEESLRLVREALDAGEVTLAELLPLQRSLVAARTRHTEAVAEQRRATWRLFAADGTLLNNHQPTTFR